MKLWLDRTVELDLTRDAIAAVEKALRQYLMTHTTPGITSELINASNQIRAHLQHVLTEPQPTNEDLLS